MSIEAAAWALFEAHRSGAAPLSQRAGGFCGQIAVAPDQPLSDKQTAWLEKLIKRAGLPPLADGGEA